MQSEYEQAINQIADRSFAAKDNESMLDYCEACSATVPAYFKTKTQAIEFAKKNAGRDLWRSPRINELEIQSRCYEDGVKFREWECISEWSFEAGELTEVAA